MNAYKRNSLIWSAVPTLISLPKPPPVTAERSAPERSSQGKDHAKEKIEPRKSLSQVNDRPIKMQRLVICKEEINESVEHSVDASGTYNL